MAIEMVACIAIEAISILEKMHSRGYDFLLPISVYLLSLFISLEQFRVFGLLEI